MRALMMLAALSWGACGDGSGGSDADQASSGPANYHYSFDCGINVESEAPMNQQTMAKDLALVRQLMDKHGTVSSDKFCATFHGLTIHRWAATGGHYMGSLVSGHWDPVSGKIYVDKQAIFLPHEMFHAKDGLDSILHSGWGNNGYDDTEIDYSEHADRSLDQPATP